MVTLTGFDDSFQNVGDIWADVTFQHETKMHFNCAGGILILNVSQIG